MAKKNRTYLNAQEREADLIRKGFIRNSPSFKTYNKHNLADNLDHQYVKYDPMSNTNKIISSGFPITTN